MSEISSWKPVFLIRRPLKVQTKALASRYRRVLSLTQKIMPPRYCWNKDGRTARRADSDPRAEIKDHGDQLTYLCAWGAQIQSFIGICSQSRDSERLISIDVADVCLVFILPRYFLLTSRIAWIIRTACPVRRDWSCCVEVEMVWYLTRRPL